MIALPKLNSVSFSLSHRQQGKCRRNAMRLLTLSLSRTWLFNGSINQTSLRRTKNKESPERKEDINIYMLLCAFEEISTGGSEEERKIEHAFRTDCDASADLFLRQVRGEKILPLCRWRKGKLKMKLPFCVFANEDFFCWRSLKLRLIEFRLARELFIFSSNYRFKLLSAVSEALILALWVLASSGASEFIHRNWHFIGFVYRMCGNSGICKIRRGWRWKFSIRSPRLKLFCKFFMLLTNEIWFF